MPGWHEATEELRQQGKLRMIGIVQEQHPERARLFMQWKRMDWPLLVDSLNLLEVPYVPITLAIDEHGIVRAVRPAVEDLGELRESFLERQFEAPEGGPPGRGPVEDISRLKAEAVRSGTAGAWSRYAQQLFLWGGRRRLDEAVEGFRRAVAAQPDDGYARFRLGVVLRARYDAGAGGPADFREAIEQWTRALELDPNNYIWRRRIEQWGPRLGKPYPFYDWVRQARSEIAARGEVPLALAVEPTGAELAHPARAFDAGGAEAERPDPAGKVNRDRGRMIRIETTVVPRAVAPGDSARVHVALRPRPGSDAHWNNEAGDLVLWVEPPAGWAVDRRRLTVPRPAEPVSLETRRLEFEVRVAPDAASGEARLPAYALYYVCQGPGGACLYRRQELSIPLQIGD